MLFISYAPIQISTHLPLHKQDLPRSCPFPRTAGATQTQNTNHALSTQGHATFCFFPSSKSTNVHLLPARVCTGFLTAGRLLQFAPSQDCCGDASSGQCAGAGRLPRLPPTHLHPRREAGARLLRCARSARSPHLSRETTEEQGRPRRRPHPGSAHPPRLADSTAVAPPPAVLQPPGAFPLLRAAARPLPLLGTAPPSVASHLRRAHLASPDPRKPLPPSLRSAARVLGARLLRGKLLLRLGCIPTLHSPSAPPTRVPHRAPAPSSLSPAGQPPPPWVRLPWGRPCTLIGAGEI